MVKKTKLKKTLIEQILDKANISYQSLCINALERELPDTISASDIYKTLALFGDKKSPIIGIIPLTEHLCEKRLAKVSGHKKVSMIPQKELQGVTGYVHGANNPVGIHQKHKYPIYIDQSARIKKDIIVSAGEVGRSIKIDSQELAAFVNAEFADIIKS
ncbi:YbaK/EbsC family protein [Streptococcus phocae subsp. salmonis]|uniref:YbaK/EbsC family protein n=1 Tax=Streptococcus phocae TaxID=119224 RepID=UPI00053109BF|nr:YbaK/EbsC family protein [Streptococcus phocae]KGR73245.1 prolyl-tRNA synthetase [Streptococcus phocae subsp. salmonis]